MKMSYLYLVSGLLSAAMLVGCGGSGGGGASTASAADITSDNVNDLSMAATEAAKSASESDTPDVNLPFKSSADSSVTNKLQSLPSQVTGISDAEINALVCPGGGSVNITGLDNINENTTSVNFDMSFSGCNDSYGTIIQSGSVSYSGDINGNFTMTYSNLVVTYAGQTETLNGSMSCNSNGSCSENLSYSGEFTGRTYQTENMQVTGDAYSGYNVSGSVTDPQHGVIEIDASGLTFNCPGGQPGTGQITITSGGESASVSFDSCASFTVTYNGTPTTVNWSDYGL